jgi:hypothetical protein
MNLADQPAFPGVTSSNAASDSYNNPFTAFEAYEGMTLRQFYAGLAMQGILASDVLMKQVDKPMQAMRGVDPNELVASMATDMADALITELGKQPETTPPDSSGKTQE